MYRVRIRPIRIGDRHVHRIEPLPRVEPAVDPDWLADRMRELDDLEEWLRDANADIDMWGDPVMDLDDGEIPLFEPME